jgi:hypothetical protein
MDDIKIEKQSNMGWSLPMLFVQNVAIKIQCVSFWPHSVFGQKYLFVKDASQGFNYSEVLQSQKISGSLSAIRTMCHPVRTPICHCFIRPDDVPYRLDARQTKHHPF